MKSPTPRRHRFLDDDTHGLDFVRVCRTLLSVFAHHIEPNGRMADQCAYVDAEVWSDVV